MRRLGGSRWRLRRTRCAMGFESTLGWKLLYREELREAPVIDAHRYTADVAIHIQIIVTLSNGNACHECSTASVEMRSVNGNGYNRPLLP
jgi:hypothetical protein